MDTLIKAIRNEVKFKQEQFAAFLGTTVGTINRWENGKTLPNATMQKKLVEFCRREKIESFVCEQIIESYKHTSESDDLILYHGSKKGINGAISPTGRKETDFGRGFYMGTDVMQPLTLICGEDSPKMYTLRINLKELKVLDIPLDMDWAFLIAYNRGHMEGYSNSPLFKRYAKMENGYDIVTGYIANDRMYQVMNRFFEGDITNTALLNSISALMLGKQFACISQKACDNVEILSKRTVTPFELSFLRELSANHRKEGIRVAEDIVKQYRREGKYFDELLVEG